MSETIEIIDTDTGAEALARILYEIIDIGEGGNYLREAAEKVIDLFQCADTDIGKRTLEELEVLRINSDSSSAHNMYRALQRIAKLGKSHVDISFAVAIAETAMYEVKR